MRHRRAGAHAIHVSKVPELRRRCFANDQYTLMSCTFSIQRGLFMSTTGRKHAGWASTLGLFMGLLLPPGSYAVPLEEIVVTAQRRAQTLQEVGLNVTALTAEDVESLRVEVAHDLVRYV